jgi:hypothetical protein
MHSPQPALMMFLAPLLMAVLCSCDHPVDGPKVQQEPAQAMRDTSRGDAVLPPAARAQRT